MRTYYVTDFNGRCVSVEARSSREAEYLAEVHDQPLTKPFSIVTQAQAHKDLAQALNDSLGDFLHS